MVFIQFSTKSNNQVEIWAVSLKKEARLSKIPLDINIIQVVAVILDL